MIKFEDGEIIDLLPDVLKDNPQVKAFSYAFKREFDYILASIENIIIYPAIDSQMDDILDHLAVELRTQHYDQRYSIGKKRALIKGTLMWYVKAGTKWAVEDLAQAIFGAGTNIVEYADSDHTIKDALKPYEFEVRLPDTSAVSGETVNDFETILEYAKNARSHLKRMTTYSLMSSNINLAIIASQRTTNIWRKVDISQLMEDKTGTYLWMIEMTAPNMVDYRTGDLFDPVGIKVTAYYTDGSRKQVNADISPLKGTVMPKGEQVITATYTENGVTRTAKTTVTVSDSAYSSTYASLTMTAPNKTIYYAGEYFDASGIIVYANYQNGSKRIVKAYTLDPANGSRLMTAGQQKITATYTERRISRTTSLNLTVNPARLIAISVTAPSTTEYAVGDRFNTAGMVVTATYSDDSTKDVTASASFSPANGAILTTVGDQTVNVTYTENGVTKSASVAVKVLNVTLKSITMSAPTKSTYVVGDSLNTAGIVVTAHYSNGTTKDVTADSAISPANGYTLASVGTQTITATYKGMTATATVAVEAPKVTSITMTAPNTTSYDYGATFSTAGIVVTAHYNNGTTKDVTSSTAFSPANGDKLTSQGAVTVTATYSGCTASTTITVTAAIYGVKWNKSSTTKFTRTDAAANFAAPKPAVGSGSGSSPFDNIMPWSGMKKETIDGNVLVKIPKFYIKVDNTSSNLGIQISMSSHGSDWHVSPAHADRGDGKGERDYIWVGRYTCNNSYKSATGASSVVNITRATARSNIASKNSNCYQYDYSTMLTIWYLYLVEFADWNSQSVIGIGITSSGSASNSGATDIMTYHTGTAGSSRTSSAAVQYRWIENLWGNIYQWVDGIYFKTANVYHIANPSKYSDSANGTLLSCKRITSTENWISDFASDSTNPLYIVPSKASGSSSTYVCDYEYNYTSSPGDGVVLFVGGGWGGGSYAGLFLWSGLRFASDSRSFVGARLVRLP